MKKYIAVAALLVPMSAPAFAQTMTSPATAPMDSQTFRQKALQADAFEIEASRIALERSRNPRVLAFAQQMVTDHGQTSQALNGGRPLYTAEGVMVGGTVTGTLAGAGVGALVGGPVGAAVGAGIGATTGTVATATGIAPKPGHDPNFDGPLGSRSGQRSGSLATNPQPRAATEIEATGSVASQMHTPVPLDAEQLRTLNELATASGSRFDRLYGQTQWTAHRDALALYNSYAANGSDAGMMNYVRSAIPHLEEHAAEARRLPGVGQRR